MLTPVHLRDGGTPEGKATPLIPEESDLTLEEEKDLAYFVGTLDEDEDPKNLSFLRKCIIVFVVSSGALCSTCASSMAAFAETGTARDLHVPKEVSILGVSAYVIGLAVGPLFVGPLSEVYGRNLIYRVSYAIFFAFSWPVAFAPDIAVFLIFRCLTGFFSSAFLSVAGGTVSDIFTPAKTAIPMALYTLAPFIGPMLGPLLSGFINQNTDWRWTFRVLIIWVFVELVMIFGVPETYAPVLMKQKANKLRKATKDPRYYASLDRREGSLTRAIMISCYRPFELLLLDRMNLLLDLWCALLFGILYLAFQAFPFIFVGNHGFTIEQTGLSFIGIGIGMFSGMMINIWLIMYVSYTIKHAANGVPTPEQCLLPSKVGAIMVPVSMFWLAFTTYPSIHWVVPIIASGFFGAGFILCFSGTFTYLVVAYRPMAASALAANAFARSSFAAAFPLFAGQMYTKLGTVGATALLAGIMTLTAPLPFIFGAIGAKLRAKSPFALH
ncbi:major facilitator superfamily domain-containing protein [Cytidiella melzeri]|nr:major facilitator superfamily domain-containing protein [Cytidiella melzeri]